MFIENANSENNNLPFLYFYIMISFPNAKINIGLYVTGKRPDGFHNLETIFYPVGWSDALEIVVSDKMQFTTSGIQIEGDPESNLVMKAYQLLKKDFEIPELKIHLHKQIPFGAGLGGGSSDAAHMLMMLNKWFELGISEVKMFEYAATLGSDCPFFLLNKPVFATGRGEIMNIIDLKLNNWWVLVVKPLVEVSTAKAFQFIQAQKTYSSLADLIKLPVQEWERNVSNQFESSVFKQFKEIAYLKESLYKLGAVYSSMSGSGSCVFGLFNEIPLNWQSQIPSNYLTFCQHL